jgi:hypothetical protein
LTFSRSKNQAAGMVNVDAPSRGDVAVEFDKRQFTLLETAWLAQIPPRSLRNWMARGSVNIGTKHFVSGRWSFSIDDALRLAVMHDLCTRRGMDFSPPNAAMIADMVVREARANVAKPRDGFRPNLNVVVAWDRRGQMVFTTADIKHPGNYYPPLPEDDSKRYSPLRRTVVSIPAAALLIDLVIRTEELAERNRRAEAPSIV